MRPAVHFLAKIATNAIEREKARSRPIISPPPPPAPVDSDGHAVEDRFSILESYDTVFLIDDSPSMRGEKWELVQRILDYSTEVAVRYDQDGIDIHFMNNTSSNQDSVKDPEIATKIHHGVELRGNTPTRDKLSRHLGVYLQKFRAANYSPDFKGYNLIVLTDGEPNPEYEDEDDVSDHEDARKNKAAFRLIRKRIVEVAKKLDAEEAEPAQVGIQFCQIGNDEDATRFFQYLDDRIKGKNNLGRDVSSLCSWGNLAKPIQMVDTIQCQSELDLTEAFFEKLLLGAIDKGLDRKKMDAHNPLRAAQESPPPLSHRFKATGKGKERQWSGDDTLVGSSSRGNSMHYPNRSSTMRTLNESPADDAPPTRVFQESPTNMASSRYAPPPPPPPSVGFERPNRSVTYNHTIEEAEEPEPRVNKRSSTMGSRWWKPNAS